MSAEEGTHIVFLNRKAPLKMGNTVVLKWFQRTSMGPRLFSVFPLHLLIDSEINRVPDKNRDLYFARLTSLLA